MTIIYNISVILAGVIKLPCLRVITYRDYSYIDLLVTENFRFKAFKAFIKKVVNHDIQITLISENNKAIKVTLKIPQSVEIHTI